MNLELLAEIHQMKDDGMSESDIASSLGMTKANLLLCLRMETILSKKYESLIEENRELKEKNLHLQEDNKKLKERVKFPEDDNLQSRIKELEFDLEEAYRENDRLIELANRYENIPTFLRKAFER